MTKHPKTRRPSDTDLVDNPLIGGSAGLIRGGITPDDLEDLLGASTLEGDRENATNRQGGIDKPGRNGPPDHREERGRPSRRPLQGKKTHEQQLRMLERKPDVPDARQMEAAMERAARENVARPPKPQRG